MNLELDPMDAVIAFLYGDFDEIVYWKCWKGLRDHAFLDLVHKLLISFYDF